MKNADLQLRSAILVWKKQTKNKINSKNPLVVTVHVRRKDYITYMRNKRGKILGKPYFENAFSYYLNM